MAKKSKEKKDELSPIYQNALYLLRIGMEFCLKEDGLQPQARDHDGIPRDGTDAQGAVGANQPYPHL